MNSELTDVLTAQGGRPELDSDIYNPIFNFRQELRASNYDPTLMMCMLLMIRPYFHNFRRTRQDQAAENLGLLDDKLVHQQVHTKAAERQKRAGREHTIRRDVPDTDILPAI